ncbi:MAG: rRNA maturation RNAse YbeY [Patescibacteria group bacterium]
MINIIDSSRFKIDHKFVKSVAIEYLAKNGVSSTLDLNIVFVGKRKMLYIATVYKREPEALPVLSFPYLTDKKMMKKQADEIEENGEVKAEQLVGKSLIPSEVTETNNLIGEIFICYPQAVLLAAERNKKVNDILKWLTEHGIDNLVNK